MCQLACKGLHTKPCALVRTYTLFSTADKQMLVRQGDGTLYHLSIPDAATRTHFVSWSGLEGGWLLGRG